MATPKNYARARTRDIVQSGEDVRARVRALTLQVLDNGMDLGRVSELATEVMESAADTLRGGMPEREESTLREVYDGLTAGLDEAARAAAEAVRDAQARGTQANDRKAASNSRALLGMEDSFFSTVSDTAARFSERGREAINSMVNNSRQTGTGMRREAQGMNDGAQMLTETAEIAVDVMRKGAEAVLGAASGLLQGMADRAGMRDERRGGPAYRSTTTTTNPSTTTSSSRTGAAKRSSGGRPEKKKAGKKSSGKTTGRSSTKKTAKKAAKSVKKTAKKAVRKTAVSVARAAGARKIPKKKSRSR